MKKIIVLIMLMLNSLFISCGNSVEWGTGYDAADNSVYVIESEEILQYEKHVYETCVNNGYEYKKIQNDEAMISYYISNSESAFLMSFISDGDNSTYISIDVENDNLHMSECMIDLIENFEFIETFLSVFSADSITENVMLNFMGDSTNEYNLSNADDRLLFKMQQVENTSLTYTITCQNGKLAENYKENDKVCEVFSIWTPLDQSKFERD